MEELIISDVNVLDPALLALQETVTAIVANQVTTASIFMFLISCIGIVLGAVLGKSFLSQWKPGV